MWTHLKSYHEIVGILKAVNSSENQIDLTFSIEKEVELPKDAIPKEQLEKLLGEQIGLFNNCGSYKIRKIKKTGDKEKSKA